LGYTSYNSNELATDGKALFGDGAEITQLTHLKAWLRFNLEYEAKYGQLIKKEIPFDSFFIDQFNFIDNTFTDEAEFRVFAEEAKQKTISKEYLDSYLSASFQLIENHCEGYGLWAARDILVDHIYNGTFATGGRGWDFMGGGYIQKGIFLPDDQKIAGNVAVIPPNAGISQNFAYCRIDATEGNFNLLLLGYCLEDSVLEVGFLGRIEEIYIQEGQFEVVLPQVSKENIDYQFKLTCKSGNIILERIGLYNIILSLGLFDRHFVGSDAGHVLSQIQSTTLKSSSSIPKVERSKVKI
jgi:hypothetical protein